MARHLFGEQLWAAERFAALLATAGVQRGLIGPREVPRLWERHLVNCALLARAVPTNADVCDLGSGAGLPGLVLALHRRDLQVTLVEPQARRVDFLREAIIAVPLDNVTVLRSRAEELHGGHVFSVVTARAVAPLGRLLDWSMPLVRPGGVLLAIKGATADAEIEAARAALAQHRTARVAVLRLGQDLLDPPTTVVRVEAGSASG
ncbi:16S rRNA (guanine(527)-N(7))-methyltransferase RsmG [soil metagenome]